MKLRYFYIILINVSVSLLVLYLLQNKGIVLNVKYLGFVFIVLFASVIFLVAEKIKSTEKKNKYLVIAIALTMFFLILEIIDLKRYVNHDYHIKLYNPPVGKYYHVYSPNSVVVDDKKEFVHKRTTNSLGLCDKEPIVKTDSTIFTIIGIGDSFTEGYGATADSTWIKFFEQALKGKFPEKQFQFINAGVSGSDPAFEYVLLKDKLLKYKPNLVILQLGYDLQEMMIRGGMERFQNDSTLKYREKPFWYPFYKISGLFRIIARTFLCNELLIPKWENKKAENKAKDDIKSILLLFREMSKSRNFQFVMVVHPEYWEVIKGKYDYWSEIIQFAQENNIITIDLLDYYYNTLKLNKSNVFDYYWPKDGHHNAKGYKIFAEGLMKHIQKEKLIGNDF